MQKMHFNEWNKSVEMSLRVATLCYKRRLMLSLLMGLQLALLSTSIQYAGDWCLLSVRLLSCFFRQEFLLNWWKGLSFANIDSTCYMLHESKSAILIIAYNITAAHITCAFQYGIKLILFITYLCNSNFLLVSFKDIIFLMFLPFPNQMGRNVLQNWKKMQGIWTK